MSTEPEASDTEREPTTWTLAPDEFAATKDRAAKINARAIRRGFTGRIEVTGTPREITETDEAGLPRTRIVIDTRIEGEAPRYNGWQFLAAVDSIETETGPEFVLRTAPGVEESGVDRAALAAGRCEHCGTVRANRRYTYLVRHESGETRQVGSTCIKDFTGWPGKPVFLSEDELRDELTDFLGGFTTSGPQYTPETVVAAAWAISRRYGWAPASSPGASTRDLVSSYLYGTSRAARELRQEIAPEVAAAAEMGQTIISALLEGLDGNGDYATNLRICLRATHVESRHMGIVVSAVSAYERLTAERARRWVEADEKARLRAESQFIGTVGEKVTITGTVTRLRPVEGSFGYNPTTSMLVIVENGPAIVKMFTTAAWAWDVQQGDEVTIAGTIKAHEEYQGAKQTALVRPKLIDRTAKSTEGES